MKTYTIYSAEIENPNYTEGANGWPVGTAAKLRNRLQERFPELQVELVDNVVGGSLCSGCSEEERDSYRVAVSQILSEL